MELFKFTLKIGQIHAVGGHAAPADGKVDVPPCLCSILTRTYRPQNICITEEDVRQQEERVCRARKSLENALGSLRP